MNAQRDGWSGALSALRELSEAFHAEFQSPDITAHVSRLQHDGTDMWTKKDKRGKQSLWQFPQVIFYGKV
jgi:hypothetical protein